MRFGYKVDTKLICSKNNKAAVIIGEVDSSSGYIKVLAYETSNAYKGTISKSIFVNCDTNNSVIIDLNKDIKNGILSYSIKELVGKKTIHIGSGDSLVVSCNTSDDIVEGINLFCGFEFLKRFK